MKLSNIWDGVKYSFKSWEAKASDDDLIQRLASSIYMDLQIDGDDGAAIARKIKIEIERRYLESPEKHKQLMPYVNAIASIPPELQNNFYSLQDALESLTLTACKEPYKTSLQRYVEKHGISNPVM